MSQVFAFIKACTQKLSKRTGSTTYRATISAAVIVAATALVGTVSMAPAGALSVGGPAAAIASGSAPAAGSAQGAGSSAPCFKASFPDCSSTDPDVSWGAESSGDTSGCEFQLDIAWGDGTTNDYTFPGGPDGAQLATFTHNYSKPGMYTIDATGQTTEGSCSSFDATLEFTLLPAGGPPPGGTACDASGGSGGVPDYCIPPDWDAHTVSGSATQGVEPLNVIISARSTVPFATVLSDLSDWGKVPTGTLETKPEGCISEETADVADTGQVGQAQSWRLTTKLFGHRLSGCDGGAKLLAAFGIENHVRIWNQPIPGSTVGGAWFVAASLEKACIVRHYPFLWHCIQSNGYNEGADQFVSDIIVAAHHHGWTVTTRLASRAAGTGGLGADHGPGTGLNGIAYSGNVEVVTVTAG